MVKRVVTVSRQFGSGGRSIGKEIARLLGYEYYDKELVAKIAQESGLAESFVREHGEDANSTSSFLFNLSLNYGNIGQNASVQNQLYAIQYKVIRDLAEKGDCVIVGRCSDYILRDRDDCLHTFFHADLAFRANRIVNLYGQREDKPEKRLKEKDEKRRIYYNHYTGRQWGMSENYHAALNTGVIGIGECVDLVVGIVRS